MKTIFFILKKILVDFLILIGLLVLGTFLFMNMSPQFGGKISETQKTVLESLDNYKDGIFVNQTPTSLDLSFSDGVKVLKQQLSGIPNGTPDFDIPVLHPTLQEIQKTDSITKLVWFGHSAFLLFLEGKHILIDPMLGESPAPVSFIGPKRFSKNLPIEITDLPKIDLLLISHDHYDHLDYPIIKALKEKTKTFLVPLGVGAHLKSWGISESKIQEFNWWEEGKVKGLKFAFTPSRHFSGRGFKRNETLWGSWVIKNEKESIFFSGDSGYGPHFKEIGAKYGPFDLALMECGQYNTLWDQIHMMPEESAQAAKDVGAKKMMPIHWGMFQLALHSWTDPIERVVKASNDLDMPLIAPKVGEVITYDSEGFESWWNNQGK